MTAHTIHAQGVQCIACAEQDHVSAFAALPVVASYGPFSIVRRDFTKRSDRLYTILDGQGRPVGKNWAFLRNARKQAAHMAAKLEAGQTVALAVLGVQS